LGNSKSNPLDSEAGEGKKELRAIPLERGDDAPCNKSRGRGGGPPLNLLPGRRSGWTRTIIERKKKKGKEDLISKKKEARGSTKFC